MKKREESVAKSKNQKSTAKVKAKVKLAPKTSTKTKPKSKAKPKLKVKSTTKAVTAKKPSVKTVKVALSPSSKAKGKTTKAKNGIKSNSGGQKKFATKTSPKKGIQNQNPKGSRPSSLYPETQGQSARILDLSNVITPLDDRVVVQVTDSMKRTESGLFIPETVANVSGNKEGTIVAVGRGHKDKKGRLRSMDVKNGDKVLFSNYAGSRFQWKDNEFLILRENELLGVVVSK